MSKERITSLTTSEMKCFRTCRKRYEFEYVRCLKPIETPKALSIGRQYHKGIELILNRIKYEKVEELLIAEEMENAEKNQIDPNLFDTYLALEMVRHFCDKANWQSWKIISIEQNFEVSTGYGKRLKGRIDGLIDIDGYYYLIEHKTSSILDDRYIARLHFLEEQSINYLYAYEELRKAGKIENKTVSGMFYNIIEKCKLKPLEATPHDKIKFKKDGTLHESCRLEDENPEEYRLRVREWYKKQDRICQKMIARTGAEIETAIKDFNATIRDLKSAEKEGNWYRNANACSVFSCPYEAKCICDTEETDDLYVKKEIKNEELL